MSSCFDRNIMMLKSNKIFEELWQISRWKLNAKLWNVLKNRYFMFIESPPWLIGTKLVFTTETSGFFAVFIILFQWFRKKNSTEKKGKQSKKDTFVEKDSE